MTETSKNVPKVLAQMCRAAVKTVRDLAEPKAGLSDDDYGRVMDALATLEAMPEQIEQLRAVPEDG